MLPRRNLIIFSRDSFARQLETLGMDSSQFDNQNVRNSISDVRNLRIRRNAYKLVSSIYWTYWNSIIEMQEFHHHEILIMGLVRLRSEHHKSAFKWSWSCHRVIEVLLSRCTVLSYTRCGSPPLEMRTLETRDSDPELSSRNKYDSRL